MKQALFNYLRGWYYKVPFRLRLRLVGLAYAPISFFNSLRGRPQRSRHRLLVGYGDFDSIGEATVERLQDLAGLLPTHDVVDMGSGVGRTALPLTRFLSDGSRYEGFDVVPEFIAWCREEISSKHPNFAFTLIDARNSEYNRSGGQDASEIRFPYDDDSFDVAYAGSLFTHLLPAAAENYLRELYRVLRPGGTALLTFFLAKQRSPESNPASAARMRLHPGPGGTLILDPDNPEADIAHQQEWVERTLRLAGFDSIEIHYGSWSGREDGLDYQDLVVARSVDKLEA